MQTSVSDYLHDKVNVRGDYTQEKGLDNLKAFRAEKRGQYEDEVRDLENLEQKREEMNRAK